MRHWYDLAQLLLTYNIHCMLQIIFSTIKTLTLKPPTPASAIWPVLSKLAMCYKR